jgi:hypothetical protein
MTAPRACPRCGASAHANQEYCLDCGLALRPERPRRWTGIGDRTLLAVVLLVLGAFGALAAVAVGRSGSTGTIVATQVRRVAAPVRAPSLPVIPTTTAAAVPPTLPTTTQAASPLTAWTLADGYTVVLVTLPRADGRARAEDEAKLAIAKGLTDVGVIDSNEYSGLSPGYFVVFSGAFRTGAAADGHLAAADAAGFHSAYERHITR